MKCGHRHQRTVRLLNGDVRMGDDRQRVAGVRAPLRSRPAEPAIARLVEDGEVTAAEALEFTRSKLRSITDRVQTPAGLGALDLVRRRVGIRRFVYVSSGGVVYGEPERRPTPESAAKLPESPYGVTKLAGEQYLYYYHRVHGLDYAALRYANVYGPRQDPHGEAGVVAIFCTRIGNGTPLTVFGDGEQTRDYVYVGDVVAANVLLADADLPAPTTLDARAFNVGTSTETSVNELASTLMSAAGREVDVTLAAARPGEVQHSCLDAGKLRSLGWSPAVSLHEGLGRTYTHIMQQEVSA